MQKLLFLTNFRRTLKRELMKKTILGFLKNTWKIWRTYATIEL